jgi:pyrroline-5-carboxylate reductase
MVAFKKSLGIQKLARSLPNTPAQIRSGMAVWSCKENISTEEGNKVGNILG